MVKPWMFKGPLLMLFAAFVTFPFLSHIWLPMRWYEIFFFAVIGVAI
jgi:hypothetical protein